MQEERAASGVRSILEFRPAQFPPAAEERVPCDRRLLVLMFESLAFLPSFAYRIVSIDSIHPSRPAFPGERDIRDGAYRKIRTRILLIS